MIRGLFAAGVIYIITDLATEFFRNTVPESSRPGSEYWDNLQYFLADWGHPGILISVWVALLLAMQSCRALSAMSGVGLLSGSFLCLSIIWRRSASFEGGEVTSVFWAMPNPFSLDPTLMVLVPVALCWIVADCLDRFAHEIPRRQRTARRVAKAVSVVAWFALTWYGFWQAHGHVAPITYMWDMNGTDIPIIYPWLMVLSVLAGLVTAHLHARRRGRRWYWKVLRSTSIPLAVAAFLLVLLAVQPDRAQGPVVEFDAPTGFTASGSKRDGWWNGKVSYTDKNDVLRQEAYYWDGLRHGRWRKWNREGLLLESGFYYRGQKFGPWKWYSNNKTSESSQYSVSDITPNYIFDRTAEVKDTSEPGQTIESFRYSNGQLQEEYTRVFGVVHGEQRFWDEDGNLTKTATWILGYSMPDKDRHDYEERRVVLDLHQEFARQLEEAMTETSE